MVRKHPLSLRRLGAVIALFGLLFALSAPGGRAAPGTPKPIPADLGDSRIHVIAELAGDPIAALEPGVETTGHALGLQKEHALFRMGLARERIPHRILSSHSKLFNGFALEIQARDMARVAALPGVRRVHLDRPHNLPKPEPQLTSSVGMIGAPQVWAGSPGFDGSGVTVAVIDTGTSVCHRTC